MFDIGFSELMLIGVVALVVIGPERLPGVARTVGHLLGRLQRYVADVKSDIRREIQLDELKKLQTEMQDSARGLESSIRNEMAAVKASVDDVGADARRSIAELEAQLAEARAAMPRPDAQAVQDALAAAPSAPSAGAAPAERSAAAAQLDLGLEAAPPAARSTDKPA